MRDFSECVIVIVIVIVWNAQATARGRRMPGSCGALPRYTFEISREPRVPHRAAEGRLLGTSLWMERRTVHELCRGAHDDLLTTNQEEGPSLRCVSASYRCGARENGATAKRTTRLFCAGGVPAAAHAQRGTTSSPRESRMTLEFLQKTLPRQSSQARRSWG